MKKKKEERRKKKEERRKKKEERRKKKEEGDVILMVIPIFMKVKKAWEGKEDDVFSARV
ncbi:hypothetical protein JDS87_00810 [Bacillus cereus]|nr:hypothetical protein [Bacillus cereus]